MTSTPSLSPSQTDTLPRSARSLGPSVFILEGGYDVGEAEGRPPHDPLCSGLEATLRGLLAGPAATPDLPAGWRGRVRAETKAVAQQAAARLQPRMERLASQRAEGGKPGAASEEGGAGVAEG